MSGIKREQTGDMARASFQDRNIFLAGGGTLVWNAGTGGLTWSAAMRLYVPGLAVFTISAGSTAALDATGDALYVTISRTTGGTTLVPAVAAWSSSAMLVDTRVMLCLRGADDALYFRNGKIMADGVTTSFPA